MGDTRLVAFCSIGENTATATNGVNVLDVTLTGECRGAIFNIVRNSTAGNVTFSIRLVRGGSTIELSEPKVMAASTALTFGSSAFFFLAGDVLRIHVVTGLAGSTADLVICGLQAG